MSRYEMLNTDAFDIYSFLSLNFLKLSVIFKSIYFLDYNYSIILLCEFCYILDYYC